MCDGMRKVNIFLLILPVSVMLLAAFAADAAFYRYTDNRGVVHLTNVPTSSKFVWMMPERRDIEKPSRALSGYANDYEDIIYVSSLKYGVDPRLVKAIVKAESDFNAAAVSPKGARGLMQLMPETASIVGVIDIHDPQDNIEGGIRHLAKLLKMFGAKVHLAVAAYNAGENAVLKYGAVPPYSETRAYVKRVLYYYNQYKSRG